MGKHHFFMGKLASAMAIFNGKLLVITRGYHDHHRIHLENGLVEIVGASW